ncbi:30S ribosomal protein S11 [Ureaplasma sp. ES3154-GEN]|uniref:30S ribosomal protein S11 n=1 Tax=Ureaplasma sp. ES3154-GEN TaxID=2984844 RepID=UPI0021E8BBC5|nr:30S ribosomal protein S11 [Ureaplasma sp. ES3154-GEN]MCV3743629.1 30S ribosomal protein S11 [Ureaplasma sp. ES3154-GEN]
MAKKKKLSFSNGIAHIHTTKNNTIISLTDEQGQVISWASSGSSGYKGAKKKTPYSAGIAAENAAKAAIEMGLKSVEVHVNGTGASRDTAIRSLNAAGLEVSKIKDVTPIPHNGCRPPKKPR